MRRHLPPFACPETPIPAAPLPPLLETKKANSKGEFQATPFCSECVMNMCCGLRHGPLAHSRWELLLSIPSPTRSQMVHARSVPRNGSRSAWGTATHGEEPCRPASSPEITGDCGCATGNRCNQVVSDFISAALMDNLPLASVHPLNQHPLATTAGGGCGMRLCRGYHCEDISCCYSLLCRPALHGFRGGGPPKSGSESRPYPQKGTSLATHHPLGWAGRVPHTTLWFFHVQVNMVDGL